MSKRRGQESQNHRGGGGEKRQRRQRRKQLFLVLDDWVDGFSIYNVDDEDRDYRAAARRHSLPERPAARLEAPGGLDARMLFAAMGGSKILAVTDQDRGQTPALVYDTRTGALAFGPRVPAGLGRGIDAVVEAGGGVHYAFSSPSYNDDETFVVMSWSPAAALGQRDADPRHYPGEEVTTCRGDCPGILRSTYAFDTERRAWRWHAWARPFKGAGHFHAELDAWVGLHRDGYVCACRVPAAADDSGSATPVRLGAVELDWRRVEEKMFRRDEKRHVRASLTSMGAGRFCLLESVEREEMPDDGYDHTSDPDGCVLYITMFSLKYDHKGQLRTTDLRSTRSYLVSKHKDHSFAPVAFWM